MKKLTLFKTLFIILSACSSVSYASENSIQTQNYQLPAGIERLNCQLQIKFSNGVTFGPAPITIENKPTYTDNGVVTYLCGKTNCQWLDTTIKNCDQHAVLVDPKSVKRTNLAFDYTNNKYVATPNTMLFTFKIANTKA